MKTKTASLSPLALDFLVGKLEGHDVYVPAHSGQPWLQIRTEAGPAMCSKYSEDEVLAGWLIISREGITVGPHTTSPCIAHYGPSQNVGSLVWNERFVGPTYLMAGLRCFVASKMGPEVDVPDELQSPIKSDDELLSTRAPRPRG